MKDSYLDVRLLVGLVLGGPIAVGGVWLMPQLWRVEADVHKEEATRWWPFGEALREGFLRSVPVAVIMCLFLELGGVANLFEKLLTGEASHLARQLSAIFWIPALVMIPVFLGVHLFNRPKIVVPPAARDEPGAVVLWWSSRKYKKKAFGSKQ